MARLEQSVGIAASTILLKREVNLSHAEDVLVIAIAVISSATSSIIDVEARTLLDCLIETANWSWSSNLSRSSAALALERSSSTVGSVGNSHAVAISQCYIVVVGLNTAINSSAVTKLRAVDWCSALAYRESNSGGGVGCIADWLSWCGVSAGHAASTVALSSAEALIFGQ